MFAIANKVVTVAIASERMTVHGTDLTTIDITTENILIINTPAAKPFSQLALANAFTCRSISVMSILQS